MTVAELKEHFTKHISPFQEIERSDQIRNIVSCARALNEQYRRRDPDTNTDEGMAWYHEHYNAIYFLISAVISAHQKYPSWQAHEIAADIHQFSDFHEGEEANLVQQKLNEVTPLGGLVGLQVRDRHIQRVYLGTEIQGKYLVGNFDYPTRMKFERPNQYFVGETIPLRHVQRVTRRYA